MDHTTTRVPAVIDALMARLTARLSDTDVLDGPPRQQELQPDVVIIGYPGQDGLSWDNTLERQPGLGNRLAETFEINCIVSSISGDEAMKPRRDRCLQLLAQISDALQEDRALGGVCDVVTLGPSAPGTQAQTPDGSVCEVLFAITGKALL